MDNKRILEALQMQPLSEEEKTARHILGRLYGPIATCKESTRNGRKYNKDLWTKALADDVFKEKIATKSLFLELGHPADREETDMRQACACIPELPKIVDGDLYAYVDILDTVNGRTLKTLVDYGFQPGISSRGSGDIMANDEVDPETFYLETWDIVALPAVKKARLSVCESLDTDVLKMKKALTESYNAASEEDKEAMKEALNNLDIKLDEAELLPGAEQFIVPEEEIPMSAEGPLLEAKDDEEPEDEEVEVEAEDEESAEADEVEATEAEKEEAERAETLQDFLSKFDDYDKELPLEFKPISIEGKDYTINEFAIDDGEEGKLVIEIGYDSEMNDNIDEPEVEEDAKSEDEEISDEAVETAEEAIDDGTDETLESLKEMIRQKDSLEEELNTLKSEKTVSDAEVKNLSEELNKYKVAFNRVSELASKATKFEKEVKSLKEQLTQKDTQINELNGRAASTAKLTESMNENASKVKRLQEKLTVMQNENEENVNHLNEELAQCKTKLAERTKVAKAYKDKFAAVLNRYVESKASMLGVRPSDIINRLNENYTIDDIDSVCDELLSHNVNVSRLPFGIDRPSRVKVNESTSAKKVAPKQNGGYEIDDDLLELAGLK